MKNSKKGFTLVEVLIVVVIIAILASLIVPRMLMQTEKAKSAEAFQMLGAIKRAGQMKFDFSGSYYIPPGADHDIRSDPGMTTNRGDWADLGLKGIETSKDWYYRYYSQDGTSMFITACPYEGGSIDGTTCMTYEESDGNGTYDCNGKFKFNGGNTNICTF